jgi:succinate dehydrogenase / fumarate reductase cytochrome b subunit
MNVDCASVFGQREFFVRRMHSLTGVIPVGGFLVFHLLTNASILDGAATFQYRVDQIHDLGDFTLLLLEWPFIFLPILFHAVVGLMIVCRGMRNVASYPYAGNVRYTLQRWTGVIAFLFILWHVFHMHGWLRTEWWVEHVARPLGGAQFEYKHDLAAATAARAVWSSWGMAGWYALGTLCCVYHFANGLWTTGITWGLWISPSAQRWANIPCAAIGLVLAGIALGSLYGLAILP